MVDCYRNFATHMPDNGLQVVMFTHTSAEVWADLALILWASGLRVVNAWTIGTETEASGSSKATTSKAPSAWSFANNSATRAPI